ncbi:MAG TPA: hypothetical protein VKZ85_00510 [Woeseiaceae bacterium]|nr:hypothetical protein [Woeseiaceae bacterium]
MRNADVRSQLDSALGNVESALRNLADRLDDVLPDTGRRPLSRAGRAIRRRASRMAERVRPHQELSLLEDTRRTVREHPMGTIVTAAVAGWLVWSVLRAANSRHEGAEEERTLTGRFRSMMGREGAESTLRH